MRSLEEALKTFARHEVTEETAPLYAGVRDTFSYAVQRLWEFVPDGPEKTLMLRSLLKAQTEANLAIALTAPVESEAARQISRIVHGGSTD